MQPEGSLPCSQELTTCPSRDSDESSPRSPLYALEKHFIFILVSRSGHHGMARPQVAIGGILLIWRAAANTQNKQARTADKG
jgi:hypothetical protein